MEHRKIDVNKKFLVTGGAGFIGSNICESLLHMGYKVVCLDNLSTGYKENMQEYLTNVNFKFILGDICNSSDCEKAMHGVDYVLHQAAFGSVPKSLKEPLRYCENNIQGFLNVLEAARKANVKRVVYASSSSVYGDSLQLPKREGEEGNVLSPYALTKEVNEKWAGLYTKYYGLETIGLRYFNVFGRRQNPKGDFAAVIPKFIKCIQQGNAPQIYGDGKQSRDFTYIDNVVKANYLACSAPATAVGKSYNIASGQREFLIDVYNMIANEYGFTKEPVYTAERPGDIRDSFADISLAQKMLGYYPKWNFAMGIYETIKWYNNNSGGLNYENSISD